MRYSAMQAGFCTLNNNCMIGKIKKSKKEGPRTPLHHPNPFITLVVLIFLLFSIIVSVAEMLFKLFLVFLLR